MRLEQQQQKQKQQQQQQKQQQQQQRQQLWQDQYLCAVLQTPRAQAGVATNHTFDVGLGLCSRQ